ncbi:MAG: hypothetical protein N3A66_11430 [Planctomycetota bacterium]|nr:hypothetical protein [Planctomycetota bacterium]
MLSGRPPFGGSGSTVMEAHIKEKAPPLQTLCPDLPPRAIRLVEKMMQKDREDRHSSFAELFEDLEAVRLEALPASEEFSRSAVLRVLARGGTTVEEIVAREKALLRQLRIMRWALAAMGIALAAAAAALVYLLAGR